MLLVPAMARDRSKAAASMGSYRSYGRSKRVAVTGVSVLKVLMGSQVTGRGVRSIRQLPGVVYDPAGSCAVAGLCLDLEAGLVSNHVEACQRALGSLQHLLCDWSSDAQPHKANREAFVLFSGDILLERALFYPFTRDDGVEKFGSSKVLSVRKDCLCLLHKLCVTVPFFAEGLAANGDFLIHLFDFMYFPVTFDQAVGLAEDVLAAREETLRVQDIPDFANLVRSFSSRQLASFCRVLAMVIFESEAGNPWMEQDRENAFEEPAAEPEPESWSVTDQNHETILLMPDILARLVQLLTFDKLYFNREGILALEESMSPEPTATAEGVPQRGGGGRMPSMDAEELQDWSMFFDRNSQTTALLLSNMVYSHMRGSTVSLRRLVELVAQNNPAFLYVVVFLQQHLEVLFVLCALCGGKKREQVQNCLADLGLVNVLNDMFDKLDWTVIQPHVNSHGIHGYGCACSPKSALKIQYLRLIHNFCDRDSCNRANKQLLVHPSNPKDESITWNRNAERKEPESLIVKILKVLIKEPADSLYRFWLASCVEAFLRGADNKDQEYLSSIGLMEHLVTEILKGGFRCAPLLQINFDLLGELIKFNKALFQELNRLLAGEKFDQFVEVLVGNLVDSNVFVRSVVLSLDYFKRSQQLKGISMCSSSDNYKPSFWAKGEDEFCMITEFISSNTHRLLRDLMCSVRLSDINQDNICVLNTALIFFIFAKKNGELQGYLQTLRAGDMRVPQTFHALLQFWRSYYLWNSRGRECASLQYSTQLPFSDWLQIVDCLCAHPDSPYSLLHTASPVTAALQCVALTASSEPPPRRR